MEQETGLVIDRRFLHENLAQDLSEVTDKRIAICGCGAIGSNLAESLTRRGFKNFYLVDRDKVEEHNISTQIWLARDVGKSKVIALASRMYEISGAKAIPDHRDVTSQGWLKWFFEGLGDVGIVVDAFDNSASRAYTVGSHSNVVHIGLSAEDIASIVWDEKYTIPPDVELADPCAYPLTRSLIEVTTGIAGAIIVNFLLTGVKNMNEVIRVQQVDRRHIE